mmetsp:Transcript_12973/g.37799  ORF Transcript_12973/g.37799 Transcript_12973/m.37799 type:complete len:312 (+) Transcript_12973:222-1157(+)
MFSMTLTHSSSPNVYFWSLSCMRKAGCRIIGYRSFKFRNSSKSIRPSSFVSKFSRAIRKFPENKGSPAETATHISVNSFSSIVPPESRSKRSKQNFNISSLVYMQYDSATATYSSKSNLAFPSMSIIANSSSVILDLTSPMASKSSTASILPEPSTSISSNWSLMIRKCRWPSPNASVILMACGCCSLTVGRARLLKHFARTTASADFSFAPLSFMGVSLLDLPACALRVASPLTANRSFFSLGAARSAALRMRASRCAASSLFDRFIVLRFAEMTVGAGPTLRLLRIGSAGLGDLGFFAIVAACPLRDLG